MKKRLLSIFLALIVLISSIGVLSACKFTVSPGNDEHDLTFEEWVNEFLVNEFGDDFMNWNVLFDDPSIIGYKRGEDVKAEFYSYASWIADKEDTYKYYSDALEELKGYDREALTDAQKDEYDMLSLMMELYVEAFAPECKFTLLTYPLYISKFGGKVADCASSIENFRIRNEQDVIDVIDIIKSTTECFPTYIDYAKDRIDAEMPLTDYTIDNMISYLKGVLETKDDYYLVTTLRSKVNALGELSELKKAKYMMEIRDAFTNNYMPAVESLITELEKLKGHVADPDVSYLTMYGETGKEYYNWTLRLNLGVKTLDTEAYGEYIDKWLERDEKEYTVIYDQIMALPEAEYNQLVNDLYDESKVFGLSSVTEMINYLVKISSSVVEPLASSPAISFKDVDETVAKFAEYTAYYTLSPLDGLAKTEYITLNSFNLSSASDTFSTLAHEGYPGHLYEHVLKKENKMSYLALILSANAYTEGWAQYAEYITLVSMSKDETLSKTDRLLASYLAAYELDGYLSSAYIDYLVNGAGKTAKEVGELFGLDEDKARESIIHYCDEMPGSMACYGYGLVKMIDIHEAAGQGTSGYSETEFNKALILNGGWTGLDKCEKIAADYKSKH